MKQCLYSWLALGAMLFFQPLKAQHAQIDSLHAILPNNHGKERIDVLNQMARAFHWVSTDSSLHYALQALEESQELAYDMGVLRAQQHLINAHTNNGEFEKARTLAKAAILFSDERDLKKMTLKLTNALARTYARQGSFHAAMHYYKEALALAESLSITNVKMDLHNSLGNIYTYLKEYKLATDQYEMALSFKGTEKSPGSLSMLYNNMGGAYVYQNELHKALDYYEKALEINKSLGLPCRQVFQQYNIGEIYLELDQLDLAEVALSKAQALSQVCKKDLIYGYLQHSMANLAAKRGQDALARRYFNNAMDWVVNANSYTDISQVAESVYHFYKDRGNTTKALEYMEIMRSAQDSVRAQASLQEMALLTSEFEFEKERQALLSAQEREALLYEQDLTRQRLRSNLVLFGALFLGLLAVYLFRSARKKRKVNQLLTERNDMITEQKEALQEKTTALSDTNAKISQLHEFKENLTHMIAHDLKNALNGIMVLSTQKGEKNARLIHQNGAQALGLITNMLDVHKFEHAAMQLNKSVCTFAELLKEIKPQVFLLFEFKQQQLTVEGDEHIVFEVDKELMIRVIVNLLSNAVKYSPIGAEVKLRASEVDVEGDLLAKIEVIDVGEGISEEALPHIFEKYWQQRPKRLENAPSTGLGLTFCKLATEAHQGKIEVHSRLKEGTTFRVFIPALANSSKSSASIICPESETVEDQQLCPELLKSYAQKFKGLEVYEVSRINELLTEIHDQKLSGSWSTEIQMAMYSGDQASYNLLIEQLLKG